MDPRTLTIAMSQSGETADTIEAVRVARDVGAPILGICNVVGSHLSRLADGTLYTRGGPEISVAATKTYVSQAIAATLFALYFARVRRSAELERLRAIAEGTKLLPASIDVVLNTSEDIKKIAKKLRRARSVLFLGRYVNFPTALEGALKLKEISYIHAEGYAAGEMKHGPIALLSSKTPVIGVVTDGRVREKMLSNLAEAKAREASRSARRSHHLGSARRRAAVPDRQRGPAAALGVPYRRYRGQGRRPAAQPRQDGHGRVITQRLRAPHSRVRRKSSLQGRGGFSR